MRQQVLLLSLLVPALLALPGPSVLAQPGQSSPESAYADAFALFDAGLYSEAARAFEDFRTAHPAHPREAEALYYGGRAELATGRDARAAALLTHFRQRYPAHPLAPRARLALGEFYFARGEYDRAIAALREALDERQAPEDVARASLMVGQAALHAGHYDAAMADLRRVAEEFPRAEAAPRALYAMGAAAAEQGDYEAAADAFSRLATRYRRTQEDRMVGLALAEAFLRTGQLRRVVDEVDRRLLDMPATDQEGGLPLAPAVAAERRAQRDRAHFLAGEALLRLGDRTAAEQRFQQVDPAGALGARASYGLGRAALDRGDWQAAGEFFDRAARSAPAGAASDALPAEALYYSGLAYRRAGRLDLAGERFAEATQRLPGGAYADVALFERGMLQYATREWDQAAMTFQTLIDRYPTSTHVGESARMLAETYAALGDYARAEAATSRAQQLGAASPELEVEVDFQRGHRALMAGNPREAEDLLSQVYTANPGGERAGEALFWAAEAAFQLGQQGQPAAFGRAAQRFESFLQRFPDHRQRDAARYALAWTHFKRADYARAAEAFERFLATYRPGTELVPYTADARLRLADSYFALRRWDSAVNAYRRVEGAGADYAQFQVGQALANAGRPEEAIAAHNRLVATFPDSPLRAQARYAIGDLHFQQGNYEQAIGIFEEVVRQYPTSPVAARAQFAIGDARYNQGRLQEAAAAYRAVLDRFPRSPLVPDAISAIEVALGALGREDEVARIIDAFEARHPGAVAIDELRLRQAESRFQRGDDRGAIQELQELVQRSRDADVLPPAFLYLGRAHTNLGESRAAENYYRRLLNEHPASPLRGEASRRLAQLLVDQGRFADALPLFSTAMDLAETSTEGAEARLGMAAALIGLGRHSEAEPHLQAIIADAPSSAAVARARLRLAALFEATGRAGRAAELYEQVALADDDATGAEAATRLVRHLLARNDAYAVVEATDRLQPEDRFAGHPERVADVLLVRARALRQLGQAGRAQEAFDHIVRVYPETAAATEARRERDA